MTSDWWSIEIDRLLEKTIEQDIEIHNLKNVIKDLKWNLSLATTSGNYEHQLSQTKPMIRTYSLPSFKRRA